MIEILGYVGLAVAATVLWVLVAGGIALALKAAQGDRFDEGTAGLVAWITGGLMLWSMMVYLS